MSPKLVKLTYAAIPDPIFSVNVHVIVCPASIQDDKCCWSSVENDAF